VPNQYLGPNQGMYSLRTQTVKTEYQMLSVSTRKDRNEYALYYNSKIKIHIEHVFDNQTLFNWLTLHV
jgi:hypothetical protein